MNWMSEAACKNMGVALFYPETSATELARDVCARCPVRAACLEYALEAREPAGIWGGLETADRERLRRRRRRSA